MLLPRLYPILSADSFSDGSAIFAAAEELAAAGVTLLQLRDKSGKARQMLDQARELKRLVFREGFQIEAGGWESRNALNKKSFPTMPQLKKILNDAPAASWAGFQVYYPMPEKEVRSSSGVDLVESMMAVFEEVTPAMNLCMQIRLE